MRELDAAKVLEEMHRGLKARLDGSERKLVEAAVAKAKQDSWRTKLRLFAQVSARHAQKDQNLLLRSHALLVKLRSASNAQTEFVLTVCQDTM